MPRKRIKKMVIEIPQNIVLYEMNGKLYMRTKSSLSAHRVKHSPEFTKSRQSAALLARAAKIASLVYKESKERGKAQYRNLTGWAMQMLKAGQAEEEIVRRLRTQN